MDLTATGRAIRASVAAIGLAALSACTTYVPLAGDYPEADSPPVDAPVTIPDLPSQPLRVAADVEARTRAHFVVRQLSLPSPTDPEQSIAFEYYDVDGNQRTPVVMFLPIFNGSLGIPRFFARYFANQGWAAVVVTRGRDPLDALTAPRETVQGNLQDYRRVLDWIEQQPELDSLRIGMMGVSLGGMDAVLLAALDDRIHSIVVAMAGGDLSYLLAHTKYRPVVRTIDEMAESLGTSREALGERLDREITLDPLTVAPYIDPESVFMILTRTDSIIPFEAQQELYESMGSPEALYLLTGHRPSVVFFPKLRAAAFEFFARRFEQQQIAALLH